MINPDEVPPIEEILQRMPLEADLLHSQKIGQVLLEGFEHDPFIDNLNSTIKYPEDAP